MSEAAWDTASPPEWPPRRANGPGTIFPPAQKNLVFFTCPRVFALAPRERRVCERQAGRHDLSLMRWAVCPPSFVELGAREGTALMRAGGL